MVTRELMEKREQKQMNLALSKAYFNKDAVVWPDARWRQAWTGFIQAKVARPEAPATQCFSKGRHKSYYRFNASPVLDDQLLLPGFQDSSLSNIKKLCSRELLVVSDTSVMNFNATKGQPTRHGLSRFSTQRQGFLSHITLALSADKPYVPLGILDIHNFIHASQIDHDYAQKFWSQRGGLWSNEQDRWVERIREVDDLLAPTGYSPIFINDREGDCLRDLVEHTHAKRRFIIRASQLSRVARDAEGELESAHLGELLDEMSRQVPWAERELEVSERAQEATHKTHHPKRAARRACFEVRARRVVLGAAGKAQAEVTVVWAQEVRVPAGEEAMRWVLLTSEPVESRLEALQVLDWYSARWKIEELFKALKTGTDFESRQLESVEGLLKEQTMSLVVALGLLGLRDWARARPDAAAATVLDEQEIEVLRALMPHLPWSERPTCAQVMEAVAKLGGWIKRKDSPPGWIVLGRGYAELKQAVRIWRLARGMPQKDVGNC